MTEQILTHDEVDRLLPWYVNETLDDDKRNFVGAHLEDCAECRDSLDLLLSMKNAINDRRTIAMVPEPRIDDLMRQVDQIEQPGALSARPWLIAASLAVVALAAVLLFAVRPDAPTDPAFRTATSGVHSPPVGYVLNLRFADNVTQPDRGDLLAEIGASVLASREDGELQVVIPMEAVSVQQLEDFTRNLLRRPEVEMATIVALQLPVQRDD